MSPLPAPIAVACAPYEAAGPPFARLHRLIDVYEAILEYAAVLAVQAFHAAGLAPDFPAVDAFVRGRLQRPHLGAGRGG